MSFTESDERRALRSAAAELGHRYGHEYYIAQARSGGKLTELWHEAGQLGYLGREPARALRRRRRRAVRAGHRAGGTGRGRVPAADDGGLPGHLRQRSSPASAPRSSGSDWLPGLADGRSIWPSGSPSRTPAPTAHRMTTVARARRRRLAAAGRKVFISGVDEADAVLVVAGPQDARTGRLQPALFVVPTRRRRASLPADRDGDRGAREAVPAVPRRRPAARRRPGRRAEDAGLLQLFAGLNPERIMACRPAQRHRPLRAGQGGRATRETRTVWDVPIGAHQGIAHPLAQAAIDSSWPG